MTQPQVATPGSQDTIRDYSPDALITPGDPAYRALLASYRQAVCPDCGHAEVMHGPACNALCEDDPRFRCACLPARQDAEDDATESVVL